MSQVIFPISIQRLVCTGCGAEANASCNCGKPYVPREAAEQFFRENPNASIREAEEQIGVSHGTAQRAREAVPRGTPETVVGRDGKTYPAKMDVHYSSQTDEWATPQDLFDELNAEFGFGLDVCALPSSAKCEKYFTPEVDGLAQEWIGSCWMNPPYGDVIGDWIQKAKQSAENGATVVCLVPARVDTNWWWDNCRYAEIRFIRGRLKFGKSENSAPFPSAVVVFGRKPRVIWWER